MSFVSYNERNKRKDLRLMEESLGLKSQYGLTQKKNSPLPFEARPPKIGNTKNRLWNDVLLSSNVVAKEVMLGTEIAVCRNVNEVIVATRRRRLYDNDTNFGYIVKYFNELRNYLVLGCTYYFYLPNNGAYNVSNINTSTHARLVLKSIRSSYCATTDDFIIQEAMRMGWRHVKMITLDGNTKDSQVLMKNIHDVFEKQNGVFDTAMYGLDVQATWSSSAFRILNTSVFDPAGTVNLSRTKNKDTVRDLIQKVLDSQKVKCYINRAKDANKDSNLTYAMVNNSLSHGTLRKEVMENFMHMLEKDIAKEASRIVREMMNEC